MRVAALAIAVATRSAKSHMRASVSGGSGAGADEPTIAAPQRLPSTMIGTPTAERMPSSQDVRRRHGGSNPLTADERSELRR